jgi:hypothetical protein
MGHVMSRAIVRKRPRVDITLLPTGPQADINMSFDGEVLSRIFYEACNLTNAPTRQLVFLDSNGATYYTSPAFPSNFPTSYAVQGATGMAGGLELDGKYTIKHVFNGASGATAGIPGTDDYLTLFVR